MYGPSYYTVAAYIQDGAFICPLCFKCASDEEEEEARVYEYQFGPEPEYCGNCGELVWEGVEEEEEE